MPPENTKPIGRFRGHNYPGYRIAPDGTVYSRTNRRDSDGWIKLKPHPIKSGRQMYFQLYDDVTGYTHRFCVGSLIKHVYGDKHK